MSTYDPDEYYDLLARGREASTVPAGEIIFNQGDDADCMYLVREGSVALKDGEDLVAKIPAPGLFGEMALIDSAPRSLAAVADTDATLVGIPVRQFWILVHETPYFAHLVMSVMAQRLRKTGETT